jgi:hypothetical protein
MQYLAEIRNLTGKIIHLGMFESVYGLVRTDDSITLGVDRAKVRSTYAGQLITRRGKTIYTWKLTDQKTWILVDTQTVWWSTDEAYVTRWKGGE